MSNKQDWFLGQVVTEGEMDALYTDIEAMEQSLVSAGSLAQAASAPDALFYGGILDGLVVTKATPTSVYVSFGTARDSYGRRIEINAGDGVNAEALVLLTNIGDTEQGVSVNAVGDGALVANSISAGEAWLSLYVAYDVALSDTRIDALNNVINFRQLESFRFELRMGTDASTATSRDNLHESRVLLTDILLSNTGEIRIQNARDAICNSTSDYNEIGYGPEDTASLGGRRSDWMSIDTNDAGTTYTLFKNIEDTTKPHNHGYFNIRANSPREAIKQLLDLFTNPGTEGASGAPAASQMLGAKPVIGLTRTSPAGAALQMPEGSIHDQLLALYNKVNTLLSRGTDTFTGTLTIVGNIVTNAITAAGGTLNLTGALAATGALSGASLNVGAGAISGGAISGTSLGVGAGTIAGGAITGTSLGVGGGAINGGSITGSSLSAGAGAVSGGSLSVTGTAAANIFNASGAVPALSQFNGHLTVLGTLTAGTVSGPGGGSQTYENVNCDNLYAVEIASAKHLIATIDLSTPIILGNPNFPGNPTIAGSLKIGALGSEPTQITAAGGVKFGINAGAGLPNGGAEYRTDIKRMTFNSGFHNSPIGSLYAHHNGGIKTTPDQKMIGYDSLLIGGTTYRNAVGLKSAGYNGHQNFCEMYSGINGSASSVLTPDGKASMDTSGGGAVIAWGKGNGQDADPRLKFGTGTIALNWAQIAMDTPINMAEDDTPNWMIYCTFSLDSWVDVFSSFFLGLTDNLGAHAWSQTDRNVGLVAQGTTFKILKTNGATTSYHDLGVSIAANMGDSLNFYMCRTGDDADTYAWLTGMAAPVLIAATAMPSSSPHSYLKAEILTQNTVQRSASLSSWGYTSDYGGWEGMLTE